MDKKITRTVGLGRLQPSAILLALLGCLVLLGGCAAKTELSGNRIQAGAPQGLIMGSMTYTGAPAQFRVLYRPVGQTDSAGQANNGGFIELSASVGQSSDEPQLFTLELPAGPYEFTAWKIVQGKLNVVPKNEVVVPFLVRPDEATYVGNFDFKRTDAGNSEVLFGSRLERDIKLFGEKYSNVKFTEVGPGFDQDLVIRWSEGRSKSNRGPELIVFSSF